MTSDRTTPSAPSTPWGLGDYHAFATATIWQLGPLLVRECGIGPADRVLDVAAGSGNVAIRAAEAGAEVTAVDITRESLESGRREAARRGVEVRWVEGDARDLPFPDGAFDVVTSLFGAMFAPEHARVAAEMCRVCRPGGRIGLMSFTPGGLADEFFAVLAPHLPPPTRETPPATRWGEEGHLRALLGPCVAELRAERRHYVERMPGGAEQYLRVMRDDFGPTVAVLRSLADRPAEARALEERLRRFTVEACEGDPGGPAGYRYEYLLAVARRAGLTDGGR